MHDWKHTLTFNLCLWKSSFICIVASNGFSHLQFPLSPNGMATQLNHRQCILGIICILPRWCLNFPLLLAIFFFPILCQGGLGDTQGCQPTARLTSVSFLISFPLRRWQPFRPVTTIPVVFSSTVHSLSFCAPKPL